VSLNLITGRPNSGKTDILYAVAVGVTGDRVPTILLPSAPDVARARRDLCWDRQLVALRVEQIDTYLAGLWEIHGDGRRIVTPTQRTALLRMAIKESRLPETTVSATTRGFGILLERLASLMCAEPELTGDGMAGGMIEALSVYRTSLLRHELVELSEATAMLADRAPSLSFDGPLLANRFDDLTIPQERFLVAAANAGVEVWLALTGGGESPATEATRELIGRLRIAAAQEMVAEQKSPGPAELKGMELGLFEEGARVERAGNVVLSVAYGEEAEAERVTAEVVAAHSAGTDLGQIVVLYRDTRKHFASIRRAFGDAGIPADFDVRLRFGETGYGRAMLTLLGFGASGRRAQLVAFLGSGFSGLAPEDVDRLDAMWRRQGLSEGTDDLLRGLDRVGEDARRLLRTAIGLARAGVDAGNAGSWKELAGVLLARAYGREGRVLEADALMDAAAHRRFCEAVDDLSELGSLGCDPIDLREILVDAQVALASQERPGHVQVMDVERVRGRSYSCVIMAGLVAGEFPRKPREGLFSGSRLGEELEAAGVVLPNDGGSPEERLLFYMGVTRARERLILSRQAADSDGRPLRVSSLLEELLEIYADSDSKNLEPETRTLAFADLGVHPSAPDLVRRALRTVAMSDQGEDICVIQRARSKSAGTPDKISDSRILEHLGRQTSFAVTELENYARCPYSWFYGRFVRPEALEEEGDARLRGTLVHNALFAIYEGLQADLGLDRVTPDSLNECLKYAEGKTRESLTERLGEARLQDRIIAEQVRRMVLSLISRDARFLSEYTPTHFEWSFGRGSDPAVEFDGFALRGQIDRVDIKDGMFVVIDYKTGHVSPAARFEPDGVLQAPLYAEVARRRLGGVCVASMYRGLTPRRRTEQCRGVYDAALVEDPEFTSTDAKSVMSEVIDSALKRASEAAAGIRAGAIRRTPLNPASCRYCKTRPWCKEALA